MEKVLALQKEYMYNELSQKGTFTVNQIKLMLADSTAYALLNKDNQHVLQRLKNEEKLSNTGTIWQNGKD